MVTLTGGGITITVPKQEAAFYMVLGYTVLPVPPPGVSLSATIEPSAQAGGEMAPTAPTSAPTAPRKKKV